jgi:DNA polymerase-1
MEEDFFQIQKVSLECPKCPLNKDQKVVHKIDKQFLYKQGERLDILFILEMPSLVYLDVFTKFLIQKQVTNFGIISGIKCEPASLELPNPFAPLFENCGVCKPNFLKPKVIVTVGRAIFAITQTSDLVSWKDFCEFNFNPTYFYTGYEWKEKIRIYPLPPFIDWITEDLSIKDNFEKFYVIKQLTFIREFLKEQENFKFIEPIKIKVDNPNEWLKQRDWAKFSEISLDLETNTLISFIEDTQAVCVTLTFDGVTGYYLPFSIMDLELFFKFIKNKRQIWANGKYDCEILEEIARKKGIEPTCKVDEDVIYIFHLLNTERSSNSIKSTSWLLGLGGYDRDLDKHKKIYKVENYTEIPEEILAPYAILDAIVTYRLYILAKNLGAKQPRVWEVYKNNLLPNLVPTKEAEQEGIEINFEYLNKVNSELEIKLKTLEEQFYNIIGKKINIRSTDQLGQTFEQLGFKSHGRSTKKFWSDDQGKPHYFYKTSEKQLKLWVSDLLPSNSSPEEIQINKLAIESSKIFLDYRGTAKLKGTFVGEWEEEKEENIDDFFNIIDTEEEEKALKKEEGIVKTIRYDRKIHPSFFSGGQKSYRDFCTNPNLLQMPHEGESGRLFRPIFTTPKDYYFGEADCAGFQLRIAAIYSGDPIMEDIFLHRSGDLHSMTAVSIFCRDMVLDEFIKVKGKEPYKGYRHKAKTINFGFLFGLAALTFAETHLKNSWTLAEIEQYIRNNNLEIIENKRTKQLDVYLTVATDIRSKFFEQFKFLQQHIWDRQNEAKRNGYVESWHGVRRHLPYMMYVGEEPNWAEISNWQNAAINNPIQAFESFHIKKAKVSIHKEIKAQNLKTKIVGDVYDSLVMKIKKGELLSIYTLVDKYLSDRVSYPIPIECELGIGGVWGFPDVSIAKQSDLDKVLKEGKYF